MTDRKPTGSGMQSRTTTQVPPRARRRWLRLFGIALVVSLVLAAGLSLLTSLPQPAVPEDIARTANHAAPQVAELIHAATAVALRLQEQCPASAEAADVMAKLHFRFGDADQAVAWWRTCLELDPDFKTAHQFIATAALERGDNAQAEIHFRKAIAAEPESSVMPIQLGEVLMNLGKLDEAISVLESNRRAHPRAMPGLALLGQAYLQVNEYAKSREILEQCIELGPDYTNAYYALYKACLRTDDSEQAEVYLQKFKELKARDEQLHRTGLRQSDDLAAVRGATAQLYTDAAQVYISHGDVATGEQLLQDAMQLNPARTEARQALVWLLVRQGRTQEAMGQLEILRQDASEDVGVLFSVASLYVQLQQLEQAEQMYLRIIQLAPQQTAGYVSLVDFYLRSERNLERAKELIERVIQLEPTAEHFALQCLVCMKRGDGLGAATSAARAVRLEPQNQDYQRLLAATQPKE
jgi:tetratricopeptide (TPR) repeat protein